MEFSAIVYTSATGFTQRYAQFLGEAVRLPFYPLEEAKSKVPRGAPVLYLGWICAGGLKGFRSARSRWDVKAVCAVGMTPTEEFDAARLSQKLALGAVPLFYLRGGYAPERLIGFYKLLMAPMSKAVARAPAEGGPSQAMREAFAHGGDWVSGEALRPLLDWLEG